MPAVLDGGADVCPPGGPGLHPQCAPHRSAHHPHSGVLRLEMSLFRCRVHTAGGPGVGLWPVVAVLLVLMALAGHTGGAAAPLPLRLSLGGAGRPPRAFLRRPLFPALPAYRRLGNGPQLLDKRPALRPCPLRRELCPHPAAFQATVQGDGKAYGQEQ